MVKVVPNSILLVDKSINFANILSKIKDKPKIISLDIDQEKKRISVYLQPDQVSLAIGKRGVNIKLASRLVGFEIDVFRENEEGNSEEYDIDLEEFSDEIEGWMIDELKKIGCDTAKSVLHLSEEELERRTDLEVESIKEIRKILQSEFQNE